MGNKELEAVVEGIFRGKAFGSVAQRLLANGMNVNALRTNDTLLKDEWIELDKRVVEISKKRLVGVNHLVQRGLVYNLQDGLASTVLAYQTESDLSDANIAMSPTGKKDNDRPEYDLGYLPLPVVFKGYSLDARIINSGRKLGHPLSTAMAAGAARKVAEKVESILFGGASTYTFGGGTIYGYTDFLHRNTGSLSANWDESPSDGASILEDVLAMKQASIDDKHYGPWILYVPTNYEGKLDEDFKANSDLTIRNRLKQISGIEDVVIADHLTADNVVLVEMSPDTVEMVIGLQPTNFEWQSDGGWLFNFLVAAIMIPRLTADQDGNCGIVHFS